MWADLECYVRDRFEVVFEEARLVAFDLSVDDGLVPHPLVQLARLVQPRAVVRLPSTQTWWSYTCQYNRGCLVLYSKALLRHVLFINWFVVFLTLIIFNFIIDMT